MDKSALRPKALASLPEDADAAKVFTHWLKTLENYIEYVASGGEQPNAAAKLRLLVNNVSPDVYCYIEDAGDFDRSIAALKKLYLKKKNNVYARYQLVSRKQKPGESIAEYLQVLKALGKDCTFSAVTAVQYREELIRDSFVNGISSNFIRQRLLETNDNLSLTKAFEIADTLHRAQQQSDEMTSVHRELAAASSDTARDVHPASTNSD